MPGYEDVVREAAAGVLHHGETLGPMVRVSAVTRSSGGALAPLWLELSDTVRGHERNREVVGFNLAPAMIWSVSSERVLVWRCTGLFRVKLHELLGAIPLAALHYAEFRRAASDRELVLWFEGGATLAVKAHKRDDAGAFADTVNDRIDE